MAHVRVDTSKEKKTYGNGNGPAMELDDYTGRVPSGRGYIAQDRQMWQQHAEAFVQPRDTICLWLHNGDDGAS